MIGNRSRAADRSGRNSPNQIPSMTSNNYPQTIRKRRSPSGITVYLHIPLTRGLPSPTGAVNNIIIRNWGELLYLRFCGILEFKGLFDSSFNCSAWGSWAVLVDKSTSLLPHALTKEANQGSHHVSKPSTVETKISQIFVLQSDSGRW